MREQKTPLVLAFGHKARQGKDEAAKTILRERGGLYKIAVIAFADPLRKEVNDATKFLMDRIAGLTAQSALELLCIAAGVPFDPDAVADDVYQHGKQRALLQWWGTEYRRTQDPEYWTKKWEEAVLASGADAVIVPDFRFPNEGNPVLRFGGVTAKFTRLGYVTPTGAEHISENALNDYVFSECVTVEDGDLDGLRSQALALFDKYIHTPTQRTLF